MPARRITLFSGVDLVIVTVGTRTTGIDDGSVSAQDFPNDVLTSHVVVGAKSNRLGVAFRLPPTASFDDSAFIIVITCDGVASFCAERNTAATPLT